MCKGRIIIGRTVVWLALIAIPFQGMSAALGNCLCTTSCCSVSDNSANDFSKNGCCSGQVTSCCCNKGLSCCGSKQTCQCGENCQCNNRQPKIPVIPPGNSRYVQLDLLEIAIDTHQVASESLWVGELFLSSRFSRIASSSLAVCIALNCFRL